MSSGIICASERTSAPVLQKASSRPAAPPASASSNPSTKSCRRMSARLAPSAMRIATSLRRVVPRASIMFATFSDAISSTTAATPSSSVAGTTNSESVEGSVEISIRPSRRTMNVWSLSSG